MAKKDISIYVHIPFCERKCAYCAFFSTCPKDGQMEEYARALCREIIDSTKRNGKFAKCVKEEHSVRSVYFGGGTPSVLPVTLLEMIFETLKNTFDIREDAEITIEVNPNSVSEEKLLAYKKLGINRVSIGVQSLNNKALKQIGRLHDKNTALSALKLVSKHFDNVSTDIILGLQGQKNVNHMARKMIKLGAKHISCYMLEVHNGTPLFDMVERGKYTPLADEKVVYSYQKLAKFLKKHGFLQYEIANFAMKGCESKHNLSYWERKEYLGYGAAAHSFFGGKRFENPANFDEYYKGKYAKETLTTQDIITETLMLGLRQVQGVSKSKLRAHGYDIEKNADYGEFIRRGVLTEKGDRFYLNQAYYHICDYITRKLLP